MKQITLLFLLMLLPLLASADPVEIGGIWYNLVSEVKTAKVTKMGSYLYSGDIEIPDKVIFEDAEYSVTSIGESAFERCSGLTSIIIPNSVTSIGAYAFSGCVKLKSINIPDGVDSIEDGVFSNCCSIDSLVLPRNLSKIGVGSFGYCKNNTSLVIPNGVVSIGEHAFIGSGLISLTIPKNVNSIGKGFIAFCDNLKKVNVDSGNKVFDSRDNCNGIIESESNMLLFGCKSTEIPSTVTSIGEEAFSCCAALTSISIPNSVAAIGDRAFEYCDSLSGVYIEDLEAWCNISFGNSSNPLPYAHKLYLNGNEIKDLEIPYGVATISAGLFQGSEITSVTIPNSVRTIESGAFCECKELMYVTIPSSVKSIKKLAFYKCTSLTDVYCYITNIQSEKVKTADVDAFNSSNYTHAVLHVPDMTIEKYNSTKPWSNFGSVVGIDETGIEMAKVNEIKIGAKEGVLMIQGVEEGTPIIIFDIAGHRLSSTLAIDRTIIRTSLRIGDLCIIKIGNKSLKVLLK